MYRPQARASSARFSALFIPGVNSILRQVNERGPEQALAESVDHRADLFADRGGRQRGALAPADLARDRRRVRARDAAAQQLAAAPYGTRGRLDAHVALVGAEALKRLHVRTALPEDVVSDPLPKRRQGPDHGAGPDAAVAFPDPVDGPVPGHGHEPGRHPGAVRLLVQASGVPIDHAVSLFQTRAAGASAGLPRARSMMRGWPGRTSVPQIFVGERPIGGYLELYLLERAGKLDALLAGE